MEVLECDANYLFQDSINIPTMKDSFSVLEHNLIKKYRELDAHGKDMVDTVLQKEYDYIIELRDSTSQMEEDLLAAHPRTDVEATPEGRKQDIDITNDDSKWE